LQVYTQNGLKIILKLHYCCWRFKFLWWIRNGKIGVNFCCVQYNLVSH